MAFFLNEFYNLWLTTTKTMFKGSKKMEKYDSRIKTRCSIGGILTNFSHVDYNRTFSEPLND